MRAGELIEELKYLIKSGGDLEVYLLVENLENTLYRNISSVQKEIHSRGDVVTRKICVLTTEKREKECTE